MRPLLSLCRLCFIAVAVVYHQVLARCSVEPDANGHVDVPGWLNIPKMGFQSCKTLVSITIPPFVKSVDKMAFHGCENLVRVIGLDDPNSQLQSIKSGAFFGTGLTSMYIPKTVTELNDTAFMKSKLKTIKFDDNIQLKDFGNNLFDSSLLTHIDIPKSVNAIGEGAFNGVTSLKSVTFPENSQLKWIKHKAFSNTGLVNVTLPKNMEQMSSFAFYNSKSLSNIYFKAACHNNIYLERNVFKDTQIKHVTFSSDENLGFCMECGVDIKRGYPCGAPPSETEEVKSDDTRAAIVDSPSTANNIQSEAKEETNTKMNSIISIIGALAIGAFGFYLMTSKSSSKAKEEVSEEVSVHSKGSSSKKKKINASTKVDAESTDKKTSTKRRSRSKKR